LVRLKAFIEPQNLQTRIDILLRFSISFFWDKIMNDRKIPAKSKSLIFLFSCLMGFLCHGFISSANAVLKLNDLEYFETPGLNVMVFSNPYTGVFFDEKTSGIEIIHHGVRTATGGAVRLNTTPEQWDQIPTMAERKVDKEKNSIEVLLRYEDFNFDSRVTVTAKDEGILISVYLDAPLPERLEGQAGFNLEFLPASYFEKTYLIDNKTGTFPLYPSGPMEVKPADTKIPQYAGHSTFDDRGRSVYIEPKPIATGKILVMAPEDPERRVKIQSLTGNLMLFDGRNLAQNGWYVVRSLIPAGKSGKVIEWLLIANTIDNWIRPPMIAHSQLGYHPNQKKVAVIELDKNDMPLETARLLKVTKDGDFTEKYKADVNEWGDYLRYHYLTFDFSSVNDSGLYVIEYGNIRTKVFQIAKDIYKNAWHPTLDVFFPVQMDHMFVNEAYRVWHGAAHLDDALQAPVNHQHFDMYSQGPTTDTKYKPGEHIPGLNVGGWFDAGDYDIRTPTQYYVVSNLVLVWETFKPQRDETFIDQKKCYVDIHHPDGKPDILQQIEHGALGLLAQHKAVGHAVNGIIVPHLFQYTHLGDGLTMTDNLIYDPNIAEDETDGFRSGVFDDRWAFTNKSTSLDYGSIAALAAASRALRGYNDELAAECLETAQKVWDSESSSEPNVYQHGNTTGGRLGPSKFNAAVELLISTKEKKYADAINELLPSIERGFAFFAALAVRAMPYMDEAYAEKMEALVKTYNDRLGTISEDNPFGIRMRRGGWGGAGGAIGFGMTNYILYKAFPQIIDPENVFAGLNFVYGCHPGSNISFVSGVGTHSKRVAYGNNRADYSFIAGGIVPGILIIKPDFPENKEDWPFLWGENEYVISLGSSYVYLVNAVNELLNGTN
jgi:endoglucanase